MTDTLYDRYTASASLIFNDGFAQNGNPVVCLKDFICDRHLLILYTFDT